jgi:hypothetical protein
MLYSVYNLYIYIVLIISVLEIIYVSDKILLLNELGKFSTLQ